MSVLEWILALELLALAVLGIMRAIAIIISRQEPDDPIAIFCNVFWSEFLHPPEVMPTDSSRIVARPSLPAASTSGDSSTSRYGSALKKRAGEQSDDDAVYGRFNKDAEGRVAKCDLTILVEPHAANDQVLGRDGDGLKIQVTGEANDSRSNKSLIELVATALGVKPYQVTLTKGHYQPVKTVQIQGVSPDELQGALAALPSVD